MDNKNSKGILMFLLGAAAGVAIGYFLASENKEEIIGDIKGTAKKVKDKIEEEITKGKEFVDEVKKKVNDVIG